MAASFGTPPPPSRRPARPAGRGRRRPALLAAPLLVALAAGVLGACRLQPPIAVAQRASLVGQGVVIAVTNTSGDYLHEVTVHVRAPNGEEKSYSTPTLEPHETLDVGWLKLGGWPVPEGSAVRVSAKGYLVAAGPWKLEHKAGSY